MRIDLPATVSPACQRLTVVTTRSTEFIDLTDRLSAVVAEAGLVHGLLVVQTRHTTTGLLVNEAEPRLLEDLAGRLACWAPLDLPYAHDDLSRRRLNVLDDRERRNGHAHCRAALFRSSETLDRRSRAPVPGPLAAAAVRGVRWSPAARAGRHAYPL